MILEVIWIMKININYHIIKTVENWDESVIIYDIPWKLFFFFNKWVQNILYFTYIYLWGKDAGELMVRMKSEVYIHLSVFEP